MAGRIQRTLSLFLFLFYLPMAFAAVVREDIGELKIQDLLLRPSFLLKEAAQSDFSIGESSVALRWELEQKYAGVIRIGSRTLLNPMARYSSVVKEDVMLVEAFAEYSDIYGRLRFGRLPVEFGYEGRQWERYLIFPRSLLFQRRAVMLRDVGVSYDLSQNDWYTGFVISNGESDTDTDGRTWYTARWGYKTERLEIGLAGITGSTKPVATLTSGDTLAGVDSSKEAKWRMGGLFINHSQKNWDWVLEFYQGDLLQELKVSKFHTGHTDLSHDFTKRFSTHLRYDFFDPNLEVANDIERQVSLALVLSNSTRSSNIILVGTKVLEQGTQVPNDEVRVIWSLSPSGVVRF